MSKTSSSISHLNKSKNNEISERDESDAVVNARLNDKVSFKENEEELDYMDDLKYIKEELNVNLP